MARDGKSAKFEPPERVDRGERVHLALIEVIKALEPLTATAQMKVIDSARIMLGLTSLNSRE